MSRFEITHKDALVVVDLQVDFCPGGALAVAGGDAIVPVVNDLATRFANVVLTQDWHPSGHVSFAPTHGMAPFETTDVDYGRQALWPDHCVQGAPGADLHPGLSVPHAQLILRKGYRRDVDSYSAFREADGRETGLSGYLRERGIERVFVAGLALDFCVGWSAIDARRAGFDVVLVRDACAAIDIDGSGDKAFLDMTVEGVVPSSTTEIVAAV